MVALRPYLRAGYGHGGLTKNSGFAFPAKPLVLIPTSVQSRNFLPLDRISSVDLYAAIGRNDTERGSAAVEAGVDPASP